MINLFGNDMTKIATYGDGTEYVEPPRVGGKWAKGHSGNPGGRSKHSKDVTNYLRANSMEAAEGLIKLMRDTTNERLRLDCIESVLNRVMGRPKQMQEISYTDSDVPLRPILIQGIISEPDKPTQNDQNG